ncbi:ABC transporter ATP-binding protein [Pontiella sp.]|uniref:ABC transporter ATP-binding protein n=1 Tax=Pontiella sp. TaxID=2837462 RepID=UPI003568A511
MNGSIIQVEELSLTLSGNEILKGVSLDIGAGEYVSIIGPNGAGKTSLVKCIAGIYSAWRGAIRIEGKPFGDYGSKELAMRQSYVPQAEGRTAPLTVEEFVAMGRYPHLSAFTSMKAGDYAAIDQAIDQAGLLPFRQRKLNTLSGGERQMVFIAAALAQNTKIILLDEPATFLDYRHQAAVATLLKTACRENGITVLAVHHDINTATACSDRIVALKEGRIAFEGTAAETANTQVLKNIYGTEFETTSSPRRAIPFIVAGGAR